MRGRAVLPLLLCLSRGAGAGSLLGPDELSDPGPGQQAGPVVVDLLLACPTPAADTPTGADSGLDEPVVAVPASFEPALADPVIAEPDSPEPSPDLSVTAPDSAWTQPALGPRLFWPLRGTVTSRYGRRHGRLHAGVDIAAPRGTIIVAAAPGRVVRAGKGWGRYGKVVLVEHDGGYSTLYAHASRVFVRAGARVERGAAIAAVGRSGNATGNHLHFELWSEQGTLDPLPHLVEPREVLQLAGAR